MSNDRRRDDIIYTPRMELFYYDEETDRYKPLNTDGALKVDSSNKKTTSNKDEGYRSTEFYTNRVELFYYDRDTEKYRPLVRDGKIPVEMIGGSMGNGLLTGLINPTNEDGEDDSVFIT